MSMVAGICGAIGPYRVYNGADQDQGRWLLCALDHGHRGWHECPSYEHLQPGQLGVSMPVRWSPDWVKEAG